MFTKFISLPNHNVKECDKWKRIDHETLNGSNISVEFIFYANEGHSKTQKGIRQNHKDWR